MGVRVVAGVTQVRLGSYQVDIIILALDRPDETVAAIGSALGQIGVSSHLVVFDQGSTPDNLARLAAAIAGHPDATLLQSETNLGVAGGRNRASAFGHGAVIIALDNDAEFATPDTAAGAVRALADSPTLAAVGFRIALFEGGGDDASSWGYPQPMATHAGTDFDAATFVGAGHAIRRTAWEAASGYDERLFFCWEEYDFSLRALDLGWTIRYRGDLVVRHKVSPERRVVWSDARWFHFVRNRLYIERKWQAGWRQLAPRIVGYLVKGSRHGLTRQTLLAVQAAARMSRTAPGRALSPAAAAYLRTNDRAHRGGLVTRLRNEVLAGLPGRKKPGA